MATSLLLPVDGCPGCITQEHMRIVHPYQVAGHLIDSEGIRAWYECPDCGHRWFTGWQAEQLDVPCPGCPSCVKAAGAA